MINMSCFTLHLNQDLFTVDISIYTHEGGLKKNPIALIPFLLLLLSRFSRVRLCVTPHTAVHQALLSLGFSRQEHRSELPFPSPMHESEKCK